MRNAYARPAIEESSNANYGTQPIPCGMLAEYHGACMRSLLAVTPNFTWWPRWDSNPHAREQGSLSPSCLPIPPRGRLAWREYTIARRADRASGRVGLRGRRLRLVVARRGVRVGAAVAAGVHVDVDHFEARLFVEEGVPHRLGDLVTRARRQVLVHDN